MSLVQKMSRNKLGTYTEDSCKASAFLKHSNKVKSNGVRTEEYRDIMVPARNLTIMNTGKGDPLRYLKAYSAM